MFSIHKFHRAVSLSAFFLILFISNVFHRSPLMAQTSNNNLPTNLQTTNQLLAYPKAVKSNHVDIYHGIKVADPYRWLEDPDSVESQKWIAAENQVTFDFLNRIPARAQLKQRLTKLWDYEKYGTPFKRGKHYFYTKNDGLQNQSVLYTATALNDNPRVLLDPNALSIDGTVALAGTALTDDGRLIAYGLAASGSDWTEWKVRNVETNQDLPDTIKHVKFSGASWTKDGTGFFYSRFAAPDEATKLEDANYFHKLYFHQLGTPQTADALVYERPDEKDWKFNGYVTEDGRYLIISVGKSTSRNRVYYKDLQIKDSPVVRLIDNFDNDYNFIGNDNSVFYFQTNHNAARERLVAIDTSRPSPAAWTEVIPEAAETLQDVNFVSNMFVASYLKDAYTQIKMYDTSGKLVREVKLPGIGTASGFGGKRHDTETFYSYTSFTSPPVVYRYDLRTGTSTLFRTPKVDFDPNAYETKQVFYNSKDGTRVPMFITHKKNLKLDGSNPTYLYGYGGFNISLTPSFSIANIVWMEMGGVFAIPNLRGGGEYGEAWHRAGTKAQKQNVFDDFIAAAEWLIKNKYTSSAKLAISGGSNGGLLVGAAMTQRPELFAAALPAVGVLDMLRFHKFTIGHAWTYDYGSSDNKEEFQTLYAYSPLHRLKPGTAYPATMITTADHDDRVVPAHSFKFAATLQETHTGPAPVLIRIETKAGHGAGKPTAKVIEEIADRWSFLTHVLKMNVDYAKS